MTDLDFSTSHFSRRFIRVGFRALCAFPIACLVGVAAAQTLSTPALQPVDPSRQDSGPLRTSFRLLQPDLRAPSGFDRVYRVPGSSGGVRSFNTPAVDDARNTNQPEFFARVSGGIAAVFPRSEYRTDKKGRVQTVIPANTIFYIGGVPDAPTQSAPTIRRLSPLATDDMAITSASNFIAPSLVRPTGDEPSGHTLGGWPGDAAASSTHIAMHPKQRDVRGHMLTSEMYRRERLKTLLAAAVDAGR